MNQLYLTTHMLYMNARFVDIVDIHSCSQLDT